MSTLNERSFHCIQKLGNHLHSRRGTILRTSVHIHKNKLKPLPSTIRYYIEESERKFSKFQGPLRQLFKESCLKFLKGSQLKQTKPIESTQTDRFRNRPVMSEIRSNQMGSKSCDCMDCGQVSQKQRNIVTYFGKSETRYHLKKRAFRKFKKIVNCVLFILRYKIMKEKRAKNKRRLMKLLKPSTQKPEQRKTYIEIPQDTRSPSHRSFRRPSTEVEKKRDRRFYHGRSSDDEDLESPPIQATVQVKPKKKNMPKIMDHLYNLSPRSSLVVKSQKFSDQAANQNKPITLRSLDKIDKQVSRNKQQLFGRKIKFRCFNKSVHDKISPTEPLSQVQIKLPESNIRSKSSTFAFSANVSPHSTARARQEKNPTKRGEYQLAKLSITTLIKTLKNQQ